MADPMKVVPVRVPVALDRLLEHHRATYAREHGVSISTVSKSHVARAAIRFYLRHLDATGKGTLPDV